MILPAYFCSSNKSILISGFFLLEEVFNGFSKVFLNDCPFNTSLKTTETLVDPLLIFTLVPSSRNGKGSTQES